MLRFINYFLALVLLIFLSGCAHAHRVHGIQQAIEIPAGVRVGIGGNEVKVGERLNVYQSECTVNSFGEGKVRRECYDKKIGHAVVLKVLGPSTAIVDPENGLEMDNMMKVETQKR